MWPTVTLWLLTRAGKDEALVSRTGITVYSLCELAEEEEEEEGEGEEELNG